ncbi:DUF2232 domain-containing protein [Ktedonosporobacter rubrisoli]|uniref:DUF2232 domain-containing protein n=1 Tax=Ktedonosporobacter rubrisoli TaxID=2509675 RepID=A0A4P6JSA5_KTERU|nr:DUF2232 domain-containing protein [Ktedonosporobacter rubrisoli]QBD78203.1 DUF2232 domain-containing protein [Ktedonosporobacter rubrisoli]
MFRKLSAIEIAEGALLADAAVIFQLLNAYLPVGGNFFRLLMMIVFTVLVLRRGVYVALMATCVTLFLVGIVLGPQYLPFVLLSDAAGIFLGLAMRWHFHHILLLLLGVTFGALSFFGILWLFDLFTGTVFISIITQLQRVYGIVLSLLGLVAGRLGLGMWWGQQIYPLVTAVATWAFAHWPIAIYACLWIFFVPVVTIIYAVTNFCVRLLGYKVRPFPGNRMNKFWLRSAYRIRKWRKEGLFGRRHGDEHESKAAY